MDIKAVFLKGVSFTLKGVTFQKAIEIFFSDNPAIKQDPLKIVFLGTQKVLYADKQSFVSFLTGKISQKELIELTECDDLYRNKSSIETREGEIDPGHLWKLFDRLLVLVDDDQDVTAKLDLEFFEVAEPN